MCLFAVMRDHFPDKHFGEEEKKNQKKPSLGNLQHGAAEEEISKSR